MHFVMHCKLSAVSPANTIPHIMMNMNNGFVKFRDTALQWNADRTVDSVIIRWIWWRWPVTHGGVTQGWQTNKSYLAGAGGGFLPDKKNVKMCMILILLLEYPCSLVGWWRNLPHHRYIFAHLHKWLYQGQGPWSWICSSSMFASGMHPGGQKIHAS